MRKKYTAENAVDLSVATQEPHYLRSHVPDDYNTLRARCADYRTDAHGDYVFTGKDDYGNKWTVVLQVEEGDFPMDPKACLTAMFNARTGDTTEYNGYKDSLIAWLSGGGFGPKVETADGLTGTLTYLTYTLEATVRFGNGKTRVVHLMDLTVPS